MTNINQIYRETVEDFLKSTEDEMIIKTRDYEKIEQRMIELLNKRIALENAALDKNTKHKYIRVLPLYVIALLMSKMFVLRNISLDGAHADLLTMYQEAGKNEGLYVSDESTITSCIHNFNGSIKKSEVRDVKESLTSMAPQVSVTRDRNLIPVNNGIFDYEKKTLLPFSPEYVFTAKSNVDYVAGATNPVIHNPNDNTDWDVESWMNELSDDKEIVNLLWRIIGAVLRPNVPWDKAVLFYNTKGNNGKGSVCALMQNLCGEERYASLSIDEFSRPFMLSSLISAMAVICDENNTRSFTENVREFKAIVTGDCVTIDRKYESPIKLRFKGLIVQCINDLSKVGDKSESFYRRLLTVPFEKCFTGIERKYIKHDYLQRKEVLEYVMFKVLNMDYDELGEPTACKGLLQEFKGGNDNIRQFLDDILPRLTWTMAPWEFLHELYRQWMKRYNPSAKIENKNTFTSDVKNVIDDYPGWKATDNPMHPTAIAGVAEPLIAEYGLEEWGGDRSSLNPVRRATPVKPLNATYRGLYKV